MGDLIEIEKLDRQIQKMQMKISFFEVQKYEIHPSQLKIIRMLIHVGKTNQTELSRKAGVSNASMGTSVRRLEKIGLVKRSPDDNDSRATNVELTERGREYADKIQRYFTKMSKVKFENFAPEEIEQYADYLRRMLANYENYYNNLEGKES